MTSKGLKSVMGGAEKLRKKKEQEKETKAQANSLLRYYTKPETPKTNEVLEDEIDMCEGNEKEKGEGER